MRYAFAALLLASLICTAKDREWEDAVFLGISSGSRGVVAMPVGNMVYAAPVSGRTYIVKMGNITYYLATSYTGKWPNLTVNNHVKFCADGRIAHLLDEDGKDRKFSIVEKVADKQ